MLAAPGGLQDFLESEGSQGVVIRERLSRGNAGKSRDESAAGIQAPRRDNNTAGKARDGDPLKGPALHLVGFVYAAQTKRGDGRYRRRESVEEYCGLDGGYCRAGCVWAKAVPGLQGARSQRPPAGSVCLLRACAIWKFWMPLNW